MAAPGASRASLHLYPTCCSSAAQLLQVYGSKFPRRFFLSFPERSASTSGKPRRTNSSFNTRSNSSSSTSSSSRSRYPLSSCSLPDRRLPNGSSSNSSIFNSCRISSVKGSSFRNNSATCVSSISVRSSRSCSSILCSISRSNSNPAFRGQRPLSSSCSSSATTVVLRSQKCSSSAGSKWNTTKSDRSSYGSSSTMCTPGSSSSMHSGSSVYSSSSTTSSRKCVGVIARTSVKRKKRSRVLLLLPFTLRCCRSFTSSSSSPAPVAGSSSRLIVAGSSKHVTATSSTRSINRATCSSSSSEVWRNSTSNSVASIHSSRHAADRGGSRWWTVNENSDRRGSYQGNCCSCSNSRTLPRSLLSLCYSRGGGSSTSCGSILSSRSCSSSRRSSSSSRNPTRSNSRNTTSSGINNPASSSSLASGSSSSLASGSSSRGTEERDSGPETAEGRGGAAAAEQSANSDSSSVEARSSAFDAAFEESEVGRDDYNNVSECPPSYIFRLHKAAAATQQQQHKQGTGAVHPRLRRAAAYFCPAEAQAAAADPAEGRGRAGEEQLQRSNSKQQRRDKGRRFRLAGLTVDEGPYQLSLYEELQQQEQQQRQQQQIYAARRKAKLLSAGSASAAAAAAAEAEAAVRFCHAQPATTAALYESLAAERRKQKDAAAALPSLKGAVLLEELQSRSCSGDGSPLTPPAAAAVEERRKTAHLLPSSLPLSPAPAHADPQGQQQQQQIQQHHRGDREDETGEQQLGGRDNEEQKQEEEENAQEPLTHKRRKQQQQGGGRRTHAAAMEAARKATMGERQEQLLWLQRFQEEEGIDGGIRAVEPPAAAAGAAAMRGVAAAAAGEIANAAAAAEDGTAAGGALGGGDGGGKRTGEDSADALDLLAAAAEEPVPAKEHSRRRSCRRSGASGSLSVSTAPSAASSTRVGGTPAADLCGGARAAAAAAAREDEDSDAADIIAGEREGGTAAAEVRDAFSPDALVEAATGLQPHCWQQLPPQQLQTQLQLVRSRTVGHVLQAIAAAAAQVPDEVDDSLFSAAAPASRTTPAPPAGEPAAAAAPPSSSCSAAVANLHAMNVATAVHRLGRLASPTQAAAVRSDRRFALLLQAAEQQLPRMGSVGLCSLLWGLVQLEAAPAWLPQLLQQCQTAAGEMKMRQLSCLLFCCSRMPYPPKEAQSLVHTLVHAITRRLGSRSSSSSNLLHPGGERQDDREEPQAANSRGTRQEKQEEDFLDEEEWGTSPFGTLACISGSLGRLKVTDAAVFAAVAQHLLQLFTTSSSLSPAASTRSLPAASSLSLSSASQREDGSSSSNSVVPLSSTSANAPSLGSDLSNSSSSDLSSSSSNLSSSNLSSSSSSRRGSVGLSAGELATVAWGFGRAGFLDRRLCAWLKKFFTHAVDESSAREIASFAWGMARLQQTDEDFLLLTLSPAIRSLLVDFKAKELGILLWVYTEAGVYDAELFGDLLFALQPKLWAFSPHDVMLVAVALSQLPQFPASRSSSLFQSSRSGSNFYDGRTSFSGRSSSLYRATCRGLRERTLQLLPQFSPLQLSRTLYGLGVATARWSFSAAEDLYFWRSCCDHVQQQLHAFYPQNMTHILVGLSEAEYLCQHPAALLLLQQLGSDRVLPQLFAEDCVQLLYVLGKLKQQTAVSSTAPTLGHHLQQQHPLQQQQYFAQQQQHACRWRELEEVQRQLVPLLLQQLRTKVRLLWNLDCGALGDFFEALHVLGVHDEELLHVCMRRLAAVVAAATPRDAVRLLGCLASLSGTPHLLARTHLHRRRKLQAALDQKLAAVAACGSSSVGDEKEESAAGERRSSSADASYLSHVPQAGGVAAVYRPQTKDLQSRVVLLYACARLGIKNEHIDRLYEEIQHALESDGACLSLPALCRMLWAMAETNVKTSWTRSVLQYFLHRRYSAVAGTGAAGRDETAAVSLQQPRQQRRRGAEEVADREGHVVEGQQQQQQKDEREETTEQQQQGAEGGEGVERESKLLLETIAEREEYCMRHGLGHYRGGEVFPPEDALFAFSTAAADEAEETILEPQLTSSSTGSSSSSSSEAAAAAVARAAEREAAAKRKLAVGEALLHSAFAAVVLGEEDFLLPLLEEIAMLLDGELPSAGLLLNAQQVCLHVAKFWSPQQQEEDAQRLQQPSLLLQEWLQLVLDAPREDIFVGGSRKGGEPLAAAGKGTKARGRGRSSNSSRQIIKEFNYDMWLSEPLVQMRIPHKRTFVVENIYRVSAAFPLEKHLIDVLGFQDLLCPSAKPTGTAELRQRQLALLGWTVHSVHLRSLHNALVDNNLRLVVGNIAATFSSEALRYVTFQKQQQELLADSQQRQQEQLQMISCQRQQQLPLTEAQHPPSELPQKEREHPLGDNDADKNQQRADKTEQHHQLTGSSGKKSQGTRFELEDDEDCHPRRSGSRMSDFWGSPRMLQQQREPPTVELDGATAAAATALPLSAAAPAAARLAERKRAGERAAAAAWDPAAVAEEMYVVPPVAAADGGAVGGFAAAAGGRAAQNRRNSSSSKDPSASTTEQQKAASFHEVQLSSDAFQRVLCQE